MKVEAVPAEARFDNTAFSNEVFDGTALPIYATYSCPRCSERIGFQKHHFESRAHLKISNLLPEQQAAFDEWASANGHVGKPFLDWNCPSCNLPARVYIEHWAGGRHGDAGETLKVVVEANSG